MISSSNCDIILMRYALLLAVGAYSFDRERIRALPGKSAISFAKQSTDNSGTPDRARRFVMEGCFSFGEAGVKKDSLNNHSASNSFLFSSFPFPAPYFQSPVENVIFLWLFDMFQRAFSLAQAKMYKMPSVSRAHNRNAISAFEAILECRN